ncbi:MAG: hypothetical protein II852_01425 [Bacteroidales bacterium]|nr:hypothetical protein [Bacteroidales bacterium]
MKKLIVIISILLVFVKCDYCLAQFVEADSKHLSIGEALKGVKSYEYHLYHNGSLVELPGNLLFIEAYFYRTMESYLERVLPDALNGRDYAYPSTTQLEVYAYVNSSTYLARNGCYHWLANNVRFEFKFGFTDDYVYKFYLPGMDLIGNSFDNTLYNNMTKNIYGYVCNYDYKFVLKLARYNTEWTEYSLKQYYDQYSDFVEGIYESTKPLNSYKNNKYKLGLVRNGNEKYPYILIYLDGQNLYTDWNMGEIKAWLEPTATQGVYKATWLSFNKRLQEGYLYLYNGSFKTEINGEEETYLKLYPSQSSVQERRNNAEYKPTYTIASSDIVKKYPDFKELEEDNIVIKRVIIQDNQTIVEFSNTNKNKNGYFEWMTIDKNTYINVNGKLYYLTKTEGIGIYPEKTYFNALGEQREFALYFPPIPKTSTKMDLIEPGDSNWKFYNIMLK